MAGNWKMYKTPAETKAFFEGFLPLVAESKHCEVAICPPFVNIPTAVEATRGTRVGVGAQNLYWKNEGAFTGEISGPMIKATGAEWVIIGHSERRQYFGETDATVLERTKAALAAGLRPIVCVGERLEEREANQTEAVLAEQFNGGIAGLDAESFAKIVIAYEPVWAIGTGRTATPQQAQEVHAKIRAEVAARDRTIAQSVKILYGGSVKGANAAELFAMADIDGGLVGGASLDAKDFLAICGAGTGAGR